MQKIQIGTVRTFL